MRGDFLSEKRGLAYPLTYLFLCIIVTVVILFALWFGKYQRDMKDSPTSANNDGDALTFVIDAGHGGEDGGAFAPDGTAEKELNLQVASSLSLLFELNGNGVRMTRTEDKLLYDHYNELDNYKGKKKVYDLKNRVLITEEYNDAVYIGIHMNNFSSSAYMGLQVYYSKNNTDSMALAESVQKNTIKYLQQNNRRRVKGADSSIYVLDNLSCPAILVECGFLSNSEELSLLKTEEYRRDLSAVIFTSALTSCIDKK